MFCFLRFYLFIHETLRKRQRHRQKEKQAPRRDPNAGLDPRTPGPGTEPKAEAQPPSHPGTPWEPCFNADSDSSGESEMLHFS